jgi:hypothetical protein
MRKPKDILKAFRDGDKITDEELDLLIQKLDQICELSTELGPAFDIVYAFCIDKRWSAVTMRDARRESKERRKKLQAEMLI